MFHIVFDGSCVSNIPVVHFSTETPSIKNDDSVAAISTTNQPHSSFGSTGANNARSERWEDRTSNQALQAVDLLEAAIEGDLYKIDECIKHGIDKEAVDDEKWTALHYAVTNGHLEIVKYLIETCQVNKGAKDNRGWTALHFAIHFGSLEMVKYLIETCHLDTEVKSYNGQSAHDFAMGNVTSEVAHYLLTLSEDATVVYDNAANVSTTPFEKAALDQVRCITCF